MSLSDSASRSHPTSKHTRLSSGLRYHYTEVAGSGPPALFLHGYIDSSRSFAALVESLPRRFPAFSLDFRGHGDSDTARSYTIADLTADAIEFLERVIATPANVIGHSMGSIVAQRVAALRPDLVQKLVLIGAAPTAANHQGLSELRAEITNFDWSIPKSFVEEFQRSTVYAPLPEATINGYIEESFKVGLGAWRGALDGLLDEPAADAQPVSAPTLVLWGEKDGLFGARTQEDLARLLSRHRSIHYEDAGHAPHWEFPERVAKDIDRFLYDS
jgi:pimeloyl-ACP methyl ester carboxylesterase